MRKTIIIGSAAAATLLAVGITIVLKPGAESGAVTWTSAQPLGYAMTSVTLAKGGVVEIREADGSKELWVNDQMVASNDHMEIAGVLPSMDTPRAVIVSSQCGGSGCGWKDYYVVAGDTDKAQAAPVPGMAGDAEKVEIKFAPKAESFILEALVPDSPGSASIGRYRYEAGEAFFQSADADERFRALAKGGYPQDFLGNEKLRDQLFGFSSDEWATIDQGMELQSPIEMISGRFAVLCGGRKPLVREQPDDAAVLIVDTRDGTSVYLERANANVSVITPAGRPVINEAQITEVAKASGCEFFHPGQ